MNIPPPDLTKVLIRQPNEDTVYFSESHPFGKLSSNSSIAAGEAVLFGARDLSSWYMC
nr:hypothetical protein Q903MT_gene4772 [Picea sitchensis]